MSTNVKQLFRVGLRYLIEVDDMARDHRVSVKVLEVSKTSIRLKWEASGHEQWLPLSDFEERKWPLKSKYTVIENL